MDWYMKKLHLICLSILLSLNFVSLAQAAMYKWVDKDGHVHYTQKPPADSNYEKLHIKPQQPSSSSSGTTSSGPTYSTPSANDDSNTSAVIKQEETQAAEKRQKICEQAKKALETYTVYRRIRQPDGTVVYLDDNERAKRIQDAKQAIKDFCQ
jgi:hypothetical protein